MTNVPGVRWVAVVVLAACAVWTAACGDTGESSATSSTAVEQSSDPPFELATVAGAGHRGDDFVVVQADSNRTAVRFANGTWSEIPGIDATGSWLYRSNGSTVIAGGYRCESLSAEGVCAGAEPSFFMLADDLSGWRGLEAPPATTPLSGEIEVAALPETSDWALFSIGADTYLVDAAGGVSGFDAGGGSCAVDGTLVRPIVAPGVDDQSGAPPPIGGFELISLADPSAAPITVTAPEPIPATGEGVCGAGQLSTVTDEGRTEWVLDVTDRTLTRIESNSNAAGVVGGLQINGGTATSPDGSTTYVSHGTGGRTWRRTGLESWEDTGLELRGVYATDTAVLGLDISANQVIELPAP